MSTIRSLCCILSLLTGICIAGCTGKAVMKEDQTQLKKAISCGNTSAMAKSASVDGTTADTISLNFQSTKKTGND